ncbi:GIY-YIG nuclease family protein [Halobacillus shinanisalinarum]|uniref:GIY-YIG nuclease family protein n=1 Tax=Halobacillus shinanisalinarum TaxID=2932258 RepID=A0ABY4GUF3_9BACI|nr:GIY-YIG nuclease family protein [Halobacillus shinanisalinarum]UOQ91340.1 GIY-YIG nuclease family protein [Halobacillus shinanisalinarum]
MATNHFVYMLRCKDDTLYTGYTNNLEARLQKHTSGKGAKYTRGRGPFTLVYCQVYESKTKAMHNEYKMKQLSKLEKEAWIASHQGGCLDEYSKELW